MTSDLTLPSIPRQASPRDGEDKWTCDVCDREFVKGETFRMDFVKQLWWCLTCEDPTKELVLEKNTSSRQPEKKKT